MWSSRTVWGLRQWSLLTLLCNELHWHAWLLEMGIYKGKKGFIIGWKWGARLQYLSSIPRRAIGSWIVYLRRLGKIWKEIRSIHIVYLFRFNLEESMYDWLNQIFKCYEYSNTKLHNLFIFLFFLFLEIHYYFSWTISKLKKYHILYFVSEKWKVSIFQKYSFNFKKFY